MTSLLEQYQTLLDRGWKGWPEGFAKACQATYDKLRNPYNSKDLKLLDELRDIIEKAKKDGRL